MSHYTIYRLIFGNKYILNSTIESLLHDKIVHVNLNKNKHFDTICTIFKL